MIVIDEGRSKVNFTMKAITYLLTFGDGVNLCGKNVWQFVKEQWWYFSGPFFHEDLSCLTTSPLLFVGKFPSLLCLQLGAFLPSRSPPRCELFLPPHLHSDVLCGLDKFLLLKQQKPQRSPGVPGQQLGKCPFFFPSESGYFKSRARVGQDSWRWGQERPPAYVLTADRVPRPGLSSSLLTEIGRFRSIVF